MHKRIDIRRVVRHALVALLTLVPCAAQAQKYAVANAENEPVTPFKIAPNLYYVGGTYAASYLFTSPSGHILLDVGFMESAPQVLASIKALGFNPRDVRILLNSHAHFDHAGGLAALKAASGARLFASAGDAKQLREGGLDDYGLFDKGLFPPVVVDSIIPNGSIVKLGGWQLKAVITPAHTRGCTNWTTTVETDGKPLGAVFMCSASVPGYKLVGNRGYPNIVSDYERLFPALRALRCDYFFGSHPSFFSMTEKAAKLRANPSGANPFIDPADCRQWIDENDKAFRDQVTREKAAQAKPNG